MINIISKNSNLSTIDRLGELRAQIADLTEIADNLSNEIKALGAGKHQGDLFDATVTVVDEAWSVDPKAIAVKLREVLGSEAYDRFCAANQRKRAGYTSLKLTARS